MIVDLTFDGRGRPEGGCCALRSIRCVVVGCRVPAAIAGTLRAVTLGEGLQPPGRDRLTAWLVANTTGDATIRAGVPVGWGVGDKTGTGTRGERNDVGIVLPPDRAPLVLAVYTDPDDPETTAGDATIAEATAIAVRRLVGR